VLLISRAFGDYLVGYLNAIPSTYSVYCILPKDEMWINRYIHNDNIEFLNLDVPRVRSFRNLFYLFKLRKIIKDINPDIIHLQSGLIWEYLLFTFFKSSNIILTIHDVLIHPSATFIQTPQVFLNTAIKYASKFIVHGQCLKTLLVEKYPAVCSEKVYVMPHGLIKKYGSRDIRSRNGYNILFFGNIDKWKGIEYLLESSEIIFQSIIAAKIVISGRVFDKNILQLLSKEKYKKILFKPGRVRDDEVAKLFDWADLLILPYIEGSQSGVINLALSFALPVIVTDVGALSEMVIDGETGYIIPSRSPKHIANAVIDFFSDIEKTDYMVRNIIKMREKKHGNALQREIIHKVYSAVTMK